MEKESFRPAVAFTFVLIMLLIPTMRIAAIINAGEYSNAAATQSMYTVTICESRGTLYDRNMVKLTNSETYFMGTAGYYSSPTLLSLALKETAADTEFAQEMARRNKPFVFEAICEYNKNGVLSFPVYKRYGNVACHLIGYPTTATESGYTGLEASFSSILNKYSGKINVTYSVDATGRNLSGMTPEIYNTVSNCDGGVVLTLDKGLQARCEKSLEGVCGGIVVLDRNGDILALASSPSFDQNDISSSLQREDSPLLNRPLSAFDVGSVFKTVVTAAALEAGIPISRSYVCTGSIEVGDVTIRCHKRSGHGERDMKSALVSSCNPYFIDLAKEVGNERLLETAKAMGFGESIFLAEGISSKAGNLPNDAELSVPAALANFAIGQGTLLATPLQVAAAVNCITAEGVYAPPRLVIKEVDPFFNTVEEYEHKESRRVFSRQTAYTLLDNMKAVFEEGSVSAYAPEFLSAAGKTSTAQTGIQSSDGENVCQTWIAGIYPANDPQYTIVVLVEDGESGAESCGPIFKSVCDHIYSYLM